MSVALLIGAGLVLVVYACIVAASNDDDKYDRD